MIYIRSSKFFISAATINKVIPTMISSNKYNLASLEFTRVSMSIS
nr:MAG TPA: hypothetical protein [Caudoviricetes sp.]